MSTTKNPLDDREVKLMLDDVKDLNTAHDFAKWQKSFLEKFTIFLDDSGGPSTKAQRAYNKFTRSSQALIKIVRMLQKHIEDGKLSTEKISVKAQNAMSELKACLTNLVKELAGILPTTASDIQQLGFTKYHMGAILVQEGFKEYAVMQYCRALLKLLRAAALDEVADRQILDEIDYYNKKFDVFCGVMESLNLLAAAKVAQELLHCGLVTDAAKFQTKADNIQVEEPASAPLPPTAVEEDEESSSSYETVGFEETKSVSSYETIESIHTVSSYEDVVSEADSESSYETVDEISEPSEYEIEEVEVSDYVTDSDASVENPLGKREKKGKARSKGKKNRKKGRGKKSKKPGVAGDKEPKAPTSPLKKLFSFRPKKKNDKDETATKEAPAGKPKGGKIGKATKSKNAANNADDSDPEKEEEKEEEEEEEDEQDEEDKDDYENENMQESKPKDEKDAESPKPEVNPRDYGKDLPKDYDPYKPVERMKWNSPKHYHRGFDRECFNLHKQFKKPDPEPSSSSESESSVSSSSVEPETSRPKEKKMKRVVRKEIRRKKVRATEHKTTKIRAKKEKPPKVTRVRRTHHVVNKRRVKKEKSSKPKPPPKKIRVKKEKPQKTKALPAPPNDEVNKSQPLECKGANSMREDRVPSKGSDSMHSKSCRKNGSATFTEVQGAPQHELVKSPPKKSRVKKEKPKKMRASGLEVVSSDELVKPPSRKKGVKKEKPKKSKVLRALPSPPKDEINTSQPLECKGANSTRENPVGSMHSKPTRRNGSATSKSRSRDNRGTVPHVLDNETKKRCYMWYARLGQPNKATMKTKIANLIEKGICKDIKLKHIDGLPWVLSGHCLSVAEMNRLISNPDDLSDGESDAA